MTKYDEYWKMTNLRRNIAINETLDIIRNEGISNKEAHKIALKIEDIWIEVFEND